MAGRPPLVRVSDREHTERLISGDRVTPFRCERCRAAGPCLRECPGDREDANGKARRSWVPKVDKWEHERRVKTGRRRRSSRCDACKAAGPCHCNCPGDTDKVVEARAAGAYIVTDLLPWDEVAARWWLRAAHGLGFAATVYEPELLQAYEAAFPDEFEDPHAGLPALERLRLKYGIGDMGEIGTSR